MPVNSLNRLLLSVLAAILLAGPFCAADDAPARDPARKSDSVAEKRLVYQAKSVPIVELAATIREACRAGKDLQDVAFSALATSNSMVISGPPAAVTEVVKLVEQLDQPQSRLLLEMEIGELPDGDIKPAADSKSGAGRKPEPTAPAAKGDVFRLAQRPANLQTVGRIRLIVVDGQAAFVQMGARVPVVKGVAASSSGMVHSTSMMNVGLILGVTPRIGPDGLVTMQIDAEQSQLAPEEQGVVIATTPDKKEVRTPKVDTTTVQGTVSMRDGQTEVLCSVARRGSKALVVVLTPHVQAMGENKSKKPR